MMMLARRVGLVVLCTAAAVITRVLVRRYL